MGITDTETVSVSQRQISLTYAVNTCAAVTLTIGLRTVVLEIKGSAAQETQYCPGPDGTAKVVGAAGVVQIQIVVSRTAGKPKSVT